MLVVKSMCLIALFGMGTVRDSFIRGGYFGDRVYIDDPLLGPNGELNSNSLAIDAASESKSTLGSNLEFRIVPDIGAYEYFDPTADSDSDGLPDVWEIEFFGTLDFDGSDDTDSDGLSNLEELEWSSDPTNGDSDGDGLLDGDEVFGDGTHGDTDGFETDPLNPDTDGDGLTDGDESFGNGTHGDTDGYVTSPVEFDTDGDGLGDGEESYSDGTHGDTDGLSSSPVLFDSDGDSFGDGLEVSIGLDPNVPDEDADQDGLPDVWEADIGLDTSIDDSELDLDGDGDTNIEELASGADPSDYYDGDIPTIISLIDPLGDLGEAKELIVKVLDSRGMPLLNAPVEFFTVLGGHGVSADPESQGSESVEVRTDSEGIARAYVRTLAR